MNDKCLRIEELN